MVSYTPTSFYSFPTSIRRNLSAGKKDEGTDQSEVEEEGVPPQRSVVIEAKHLARDFKDAVKDFPKHSTKWDTTEEMFHASNPTPARSDELQSDKNTPPKGHMNDS